MCQAVTASTSLNQPVPSCTKLYQAVLGCTRLYLAAPGCTWLHQAVPGCIRLYQVVPGCTRLYHAATGCTRLLKRSEHNIHLGEVRMIQQFKPVPEHHQHEQEHHHPAHLSGQPIILPVLLLSETIIKSQCSSEYHYSS